MRSKPRSRELLAILPWLAAALVWVGLVAPMRADQDLRLRDQARIRRDRLKVEIRTREIESLRQRVGSTLGQACRASADPASLRQRIVASTSGLALSPFSLSVNGGPGAGATVEAVGSDAAIRDLLRRLGDPARGGFLRSVTIRDRAGRPSASATTGVLDGLPSGLVPVMPPCDPNPAPAPTPSPVSTVRNAGPTKPRTAPRDVAPPPVPLPAATPPPPVPPFTLVAFLSAEGRSRISIRMGDEVRVVAVGESVSGWRCVAIDRDEGAVFVLPSGARAVLLAGSSGR